MAEITVPPPGPPVHGWMLLDADPVSVKESIEAAALYGVNHIQLSHALIDEIDQVLGDEPETLQRVETLNLAIDLAHEHGMKAYAWAHEFTGGALEVCFAPDDPFWTARADAYRAAFERLPGLDGVILMFGSASPPPWFSFCACDWCLENYEGLPMFIPPPEERLRMVVEYVGGAIVAEGRELFVRTFVHEPAEIGWHSEGLAVATGGPFTGMHKGPVQDWQPYNPHHPCMGAIGDHPGIVELDVAGEYYGLSVLPWAAPGYYRFRLNHLWKNGGVGAVLRVQRGEYHALGTPNEVNMVAVRRLIEDRFTPLDAIWEEFLTGRYGVGPGDPGYEALRGILRDTFPIRRKSHYVLGIWALEKSSDLPGGMVLDQFTGRGKMPKWDPDWQEIWDRLDTPDEEVVRWIWQEGTEAVVLAEEALSRFPDVEGSLAPEDADDLARRLAHQHLAARAWRAVDLFIWGTKAQAHPDGPFPQIDAWKAWAWSELVAVQAEMMDAGLAGVSPAGPASVQKLVNAFAAGVLDVAAATPDGLLFSPIRVEAVTPTSATLRLRATGDTLVTVDYGLEIPDYGETLDVALVAGEEQVVALQGLTPNARWVVRLRAVEDGRVVLGGDFWIFTRAQ
ncbi:MAG: fibronectin type III domain-containing protein [Pseudomonadota bacterium]